MKQNYTEIVEVPSGIECSLESDILTARKGSSLVKRSFSVPGVVLILKDNKIIISCKGNKSLFKTLKSLSAHIKNIFQGLQEPFTYILESCNVHFPMTMKLDSNVLTISNFLGEKTPRKAAIEQNVNVEIKGQKIFIRSPDKEAAGRTVSNIEYATKVRNRDRRVFQDGIFLVERPGGKL